MQGILDIDATRRALGFSQAAVARSMNVSAPVLSRAIRGNPTQSFLDRYAKALDDLSSRITPEQIARTARPIALRHGVDELYLFGSMARGEGRADSDIDFIYRLSPDADPLTAPIALRDDLRGAFGRNVDLVRKDYLIRPRQDRLDDLQRVLFVNSVASKPMFRIV